MDSRTRNAFIYASMVAMGSFVFGLDAALISGTVDFITDEFSLSPTRLGSIVSAPALGVLFALPFMGYVANASGRKIALLIIAALYVVSAVGSAFAPSATALYWFRFLGGLAFSSISLSSMYIGEIAPPKYRGKLVAMIQINIVIGLSAAYFVNYLIQGWSTSEAPWVQSMGLADNTWRWMLGSEIPFAVLWFLMLLLVPRSPYWLLTKGRSDESAQVLQKVMAEEEIAHQMSDMQRSLEQSSETRSMSAQLAEMFSPSFRLVFVIALTLGIAQQSTGINAILFYAQTVFKQLGVGTDAAFQQAVWVGLTSVVFTVLGLLLVDKLGRRPLIIWGMIWIIASLGLCAYGFYQARYTLTEEAFAELLDVPEADRLPEPERLRAIVGIEFDSDIALKTALKDTLGVEDARKHQGAILEKSITMNAPLVLVSILSFIGAFQFSVGPVMWVLFSEIFPISVRGIAIPFFTIITSLTSFLVQWFFPWQLENMGMSSIFLFYAATVAVGLVIMFFTLKETKGMSIEEIQSAMSS